MLDAFIEARSEKSTFSVQRLRQACVETVCCTQHCLPRPSQPVHRCVLCWPAGEYALVGPALSALDADIAFTQAQPTMKARDPRAAAQMHAAAQEARSMLGGRPCYGSLLPGRRGLRRSSACSQTCC